MTDYTAKIRAKGLDATGVTEDIARTMYNTPGKTTLAIVELKHVRQINDADGDRQVELVLTLVEPSTDANLDAHLRELTRVQYQNRALKADDQQLEINTSEDLEPTVEQVIAARQLHFAQTDDELPDPEDGDGDDDEDGDGDEDEEPADPDDPAFEPHAYTNPDGDDGPYVCIVCDQASDTAIHTREPALT